MKYRIRSIEVEAMEMTAPVEIALEHDAPATCHVGDFLVRGPGGSLRLLSPDAFHAAYEPCDPGAVFAETKPKRRHRAKKVAPLGPNGDAILRELKGADSEK